MARDSGKARLERTLGSVLRGPVTVALAARDASVSLIDWTTSSARSLHDRLTDGVENAREAGETAVTADRLRELRARLADRIEEVRETGESAVNRRSATESSSSLRQSFRDKAPSATKGANGSHAPNGATGVAAHPAGGNVTTSSVDKSTDGLTADSLPIPDYDQLSALQVVERLAGIPQAQLDELRAYESARRSRRTILAKIDHLTRA